MIYKKGGYHLPNRRFAGGHLRYQPQAAAHRRRRQTRRGGTQPVYEAERRPYPFCAEVPCRE